MFVRADNVNAPSADDKEIAQVMRKISVSATRAPQELADIPATVTGKEAAEIQAELATDIRDLIRYEPGISVSNAPTRFGLSGFNIRGIDGNRVAMRIDNVRMSDAFSIGSFSDARRNLVDLDMLKVVEIVRGPASALYGSDAIGGVVSFVTKDPEDFLRDDKRQYISFKSGYATTNSEWSLGGTLALGSETLSALLAYTHREGEQTKNQGTRDTLDNTRTMPNPQQRDADSLLAKMSWTPNEQNNVRLSIALDRDQATTDVLSAQGRGSGAFGNIVTVSLQGDDVQERARVAFDHTLNASDSLFDALESRLYVQETQIEQNSLERRYAFSAGPSATVLRDRDFQFKQSLLGGELVARKSLAGETIQHLLTYGLDLVNTETEQLRNGVQTTLATGATTSAIPPDNFPVRDFPLTDTRQYAAFIQDEIASTSGVWTLTPGVRVDYYQLEPALDDIYRADNPGVAVIGLSQTSVSPKLGAIWNLDQQHSLYASYARGFRAPPYNDVNIGFTNLAFGYTAIANPDLKPETSNGYELGMRGNYSKGYFAFAMFYNDYDDFINSLNFIGVQNGLQVFQSQNLSAARIYGAELRAGFAVLDSVTIKTSVAYARGDGRSTPQADNAPLNSVNPLKGVLGVAYEPNANWGAELIGTAVDRHSDVNQSTPQFVPGGYATLDLFAHVNFAKHVRLNVGVFNLTDKKYWEWSDVRGLAPTNTVLDRYTPPGMNGGASIAVQF